LKDQTLAVTQLAAQSETQLLETRTDLLSICSTRIDELQSAQSSRLDLINSELDRLKTEIGRPIPVSQPPPNLSVLELRPDIEISSDLPPKIPRLKKFTDVAQCVDYLYELIPSLDAILRAFHSRVSAALSKSAARDGNVAFLKAQIVDIQAAIQSLATREELALRVKRRPVVKEPDSRGSGVGLVRCISCGRELPSTPTDDGADEPLRSRRQPVTPGRMVMGIVENPAHSARGFRRAQIRRKIQTPL
jgi:hypothetical protein